MPHLSAKHLLGSLLLLGVLYDIFYVRHCAAPDTRHLQDIPVIPTSSPGRENGQRLQDIDCYLDREVAANVGLKPNLKKIQCKSDGTQVYLPFSFLQKHYEAKGARVGDGEFEISTSNSKVFVPKGKHTASGPFMHFENFKVELRGRVLCVSAATGVPLSTQWDPSGYYYPTQIAQFALAHYSNSLKHSKPARTILDNGKDVLIDLKPGEASRVRDEASEQDVIEFEDTEISLEVNSEYTVVCMEVKVVGEVVVTIEVEESSRHERDVVEVHYSSREKRHVRVDDEEIVFGLGRSRDWIRLTRDVYTDINRARGQQGSDSREKSRLRVTRLRIQGHGQVRNIWVSESEHERQFLAGADWFIDNQDEVGGWPSQVVFNKGGKKYPGAAEVPPGWYGAMCQGQAISVLVRAHLATSHLASGHLATTSHLASGHPSIYLAAAVRAAAVFNLSSQEGGVQGEVLGRVWYEEYPTSPSSHILNGFIYGLLGLQELASVQGEGGGAEQLYRAGMSSLLTLLPLYDSGSGTFYDLRHLTMHTEPKIARWDYHATHINQLLTLATVEQGKAATQLRETAERWRGYMIGQKAAHN